MTRRQVVLFGSSGRIGRAVTKAMAQIECPVTAITWLDGRTSTARDAQEILAQLAAVGGAADIVFASGLTDPRASADELAVANVERPLGVIEATVDREHFRYLTIGSVLETFTS